MHSKSAQRTGGWPPSDSNANCNDRCCRLADLAARTVHLIGPAVVLTTIVLALGLGVTMLSDLPWQRLLGRLAGVCLFASLPGQLIILPAVISLYRRESAHRHWPVRNRQNRAAV